VSGQDVPDNLSVIFYAKDDDPNFSPVASILGVESADLLGGYGGIEQGKPVVSDKGYDDGEWVRLVQEFPGLPHYPEKTHEFPINLKSTWGVVCEVTGTLRIEIEAATEKPTAITVP
jgi:hypothetical protein